MATYTELFDLADNNILLDRVSVAITIAADTVLNEIESTPNHANRVVWAKGAFSNPKAQAKAFLAAVLAANNGADVATIQAVTDTQIQNNVNAAIDDLEAGKVARPLIDMGLDV